MEHQTLTLHLLWAQNWTLPFYCYSLPVLVIKAFVVKNNFSSEEKPPWLILRKHMLHHEPHAEGFPTSTPLTSAAMQHRLNLSDAEVKKHLVNHFHVCKKRWVSTRHYVLTLCLGLKNILETMDKPPAVNVGLFWGISWRYLNF